jgi:hypothetical protein
MKSIAIAVVTLLAPVLAIPLGLASLFFAPVLVAAPLAFAASGDARPHEPWTEMWRSSTSSDDPT